MRPLHLIGNFARASLQKDLAYRANFWISLLHSCINLAVGVFSLQILFHQIDSLKGWSQAEALSLLGVYLVISSLRGLFIGPSLEALAGIGQEIWSGNFDFSLLKPIPVQFMVSFRFWNFYALLDLILGSAVLVFANMQGSTLAIQNILLFLIGLICAVVILYAVLLAFTALTFWSPGFLFTWVFDALFQLARYPVTIYPPWLRMILTWIIPVGMMTTIPTQVLHGKVPWEIIGWSALAAAFLLCVSSWFFNRAVKRYSSASS